MDKGLTSSRSTAGMSLMELLVVVVIVMLLMGLLVPATNAIVSGVNLTRHSQELADLLAVARQAAIARNREVEVRFVYWDDDGTNRLRAAQAWIVSADGASAEPLTRMKVFPESLTLDSRAAWSPLLLGTSHPQRTANFGALGTRNYRFFRFRPDGGLDQAIQTTNNYVTLHARRDTGDPPANFAAVQVNPVTGRVHVHRP